MKYFVYIIGKALNYNFLVKFMRYEHGASQVSGATSVLLEKTGDITSNIFKSMTSD